MSNAKWLSSAAFVACHRSRQREVPKPRRITDSLRLLAQKQDGGNSKVDSPTINKET
ncbi:MAG: hypothetical protein V7K47_31300 [Nostoc sp.]